MLFNLPKHGTIRFKKKFCFLPTFIPNNSKYYEIVFFGTIYVKQQYNKHLIKWEIISEISKDTYEKYK